MILTESTFRESLINLVFLLLKIGGIALLLVIVEQIVLYFFKKSKKSVPRLKGKVLELKGKKKSPLKFMIVLRGERIIPLCLLSDCDEVMLSPIPKSCGIKKEKVITPVENPILELDRLKHSLNSLALRVKPEKGGTLLSDIEVLEPVIIANKEVNVINNSGRAIEIISPHEFNSMYEGSDLKSAQEKEIFSILKAYV